ncbi:MAG TPA: dienelactone hydrolase family protein [Micromonosporaceae bacterium]
MCYSDDAQPPAPPVVGPVGEHGDLVLESADGTRVGAYHADPQGGSDRAVVLLPDVRGLHSFYKELAVRFAEAGMSALAIDYFGRTAGVGDRGEEFPYRRHMDKLDWASVGVDTAAAVRWVREHKAARSVYTVGFCFGGAMSWRQSAIDPDLNGCVGFYGVPSRVADLMDRLSAPLLILAAGQDFTPVADVEAFAGQVRARGVEAEMHVYPDAPHSFFDRAFAQHEAACADAWRRILDFVDRHASP